MSTETIPVEKTKRNYNVLFGLTLLALLVLLWIVLSVATPSFASANNIANLLRQGSMIAILAVGQTFVMPGHEAMTTREIVTTIAGALGRPVPRLRLPLWPFIAAAVVFEGTFKPLGIQPPLHRRRLDFFRKSFVFSTKKAEALLGFVPHVTFAEGARETADWYRKQGLLSR